MCSIMNQIPDDPYECEKAWDFYDRTQNKYNLRTQLHLAARYGSLDSVENMLESGVTMAPDRYGLTPLYIACMWERYELVEYFLRYLHSKGKLTERDRDTVCLLLLRNIEPEKFRYSSCNYGHLKEILAAGIKSGDISTDVQNVTLAYGRQIHHSFQVTYDNGEKVTTLLSEYLGSNNPAVLLSLGRDIDLDLTRNQDYNSALNSLVKQLSILREQKPYINVESAMTIHREMASLFYKAVVLPSNRTARPHHIKELHRATRKCVLHFMQQELMTDPSVKDVKKPSSPEIPYRKALTCFNYMESIMSLCLNLIVHLSNEDRESWNRLQCLVETSVKHCQMISKASVPVGIFHILQSLPAWKSGLLEHTTYALKTLVEMLIKAGADVNMTDRCHRTVLHRVAEKVGISSTHRMNGVILMQMLIDHGAHKDIWNSEGEPPVEVYRKTKRGLDPGYQGPDDVEKLLKLDVLPLQCLSAQQINRHRIPHRNSLPRTLSQFVEMHGLGK